MTWTYSDESYKQYTRDTWNESAARYAPLAAALDLWNPDVLRIAAARTGERALDLATGLGEPALSLARAVGPRGRVLGVDLSERMVELARDAAKMQGLDNVEFLTMDAEALDVPRGTMDLVTSRFGLQIFTDPERALDEMRAALKPGGRVALSVWGPGERNAHIHAVIGPMLAHAEPDETGYLPTPYEMGGPGELVSLLAEHGFVDGREERVAHDTVWRDEESYLSAVLDGSPIGHSLHEEDAAVQEDVIQETRAFLARHRTPRGIVLPGEAVLVSARKP
jgi:SAM-dependent methyltransferase